MDLRSLRYFAEIAETESFSRAAARLRRSQPALSRCMRELERELGVRLFQPRGRGIALTSNGRALIGPIQRLLSEAEAIAEHARLLGTGKTSILRVGVSANMIESALPAVLKRYRARWPNVEIVLKTEGGSALLTALERGEVDIALTRYAQSDFLASRPAFPVYILAALPRGHRLSRQRSLSILDLAGERLLVAPPSVTSRRLFESACQSSQVRPRVALETHELNALVALAEADQGIAVIPSTVDTTGRSVTALPIFHDGKPLASWMALVWGVHREQPDYAKGFVRLACETLGKVYPGRDLGLPIPNPQPL